MSVLVSISPLLLVIVLSAWLRRSGFFAAWCGVAWVALLMLTVPFLKIDAANLLEGAGVAGLITLQAALVIAPGLYLNALLKQTRVHKALIEWVESIPLRPLHKRLLIIVGLAPALESLTGFGVSLLVTVPLLLAVSERSAGLRQSLLSMNIMPWGTLGLATVVGSQLSGQAVPLLGLTTSLISFGVFPAFAMLAAGLSATPKERGTALRDGALVGTVLASGLVLFNRMALNETAGIFAGLASAAFCLAVFRTSRAMTRPPWAAIMPYGVLITLIAVIRLLPMAGVPVGQWTMTAGSVHFAPLTSPGIALLLTILFLVLRRKNAVPWRETVASASKPILTLGGFTLMAQLMDSSGMIRTLGDALTVHNSLSLSVLSPLLGMLSGYLTGSNVGGNAMMMTLQGALTTDESRLALIVSAAQNSAAGHAVFASIPIVMLTLAIAGAGEAREESGLIRFGLKTLILVAGVTITASLLLIVL